VCCAPSIGIICAVVFCKKISRVSKGDPLPFTKTDEIITFLSLPRFFMIDGLKAILENFFILPFLQA
jgi:hypothetical protein